MGVPKTPIHHNYCPMACQNKVRRAREIVPVQPEAQAHGVDHATHD
jgi:hypothetical protein